MSGGAALPRAGDPDALSAACGPAPLTAPPGLEEDDDLVPISALQHQLFCPRQCALIHLEQQWLENAATAQGRILHERVDDGAADRRRGLRIVRGLSLHSRALRVTGRADVVELHRATAGDRAGWRPLPVEYKRGKPKAHRADEVQLCAQAICLEEMFDCAVPEGALFYGATRRRTVVAIDDGLRALTARIAGDVHAMLASGRTPAPVAMPACASCSLQPLCRPHAIAARPAVSRWLARQLAD